MSDTKVLTPEQIDELRAAIAAQPDHANVPSEECPRCAWQSKLGDVAISLLDAAERCGSLAIELQEVKRVDLEQMEWMSERINELDRRNDEQDRHRRKALADLAAVRGACALALRWLGDPDDPNGTFEDIGAWYQRETGRLRPGKSLPMAMAGDSQEEREKHFCAWADAKGREVRAALKSAGGASRTERGAHAKGFA